MRNAAEIRSELQLVELAVTNLRAELATQVQAEEKQAAEKSGAVNHHGYWRPDGSCSYCGSMTTAEALRRLGTPGTNYSGADWKYGWPHKFYIDGHLFGYPHKFYNAHLADATEQEFAAFAALSSAFFEVMWSREKVAAGIPPAIKWKARSGIQLSGITREIAGIMPISPTSAS